METSASGAQDGTLYALDVPPPVNQLVDTHARQALSYRLTSSSWSVLWVEGPTGAGKSTTVANTLLHTGGFRGMQRIDCSSAPRIEEVLYQVSDFLLQLGIDDLHNVLNQRSAFRAKLGVLLRAIAENDVLLWLDEFHSIRAGHSEEDTDALEEFARNCSELPAESNGRLLITSDRAPPDGVTIDRWTLPALSADEALEIWRSLGTSSFYSELPWPDAGFPPDLEALPLALRLLFATQTFGGPEAVADYLHRSEVENGLAELYGTTVELLSDSAREFLEALAHYGRPLSRGALRQLSVATGREVSFDSDAVDERITELERSGLLRSSESDGYGPALYTVHPVALAAVRDGIHELSDEQREALFVAAANHFLRYAKNNDNLWSLFNARECFFKAGRFDEACQVQKCFIEDLLRLGYFDVAHDVLLETIETTSGNTRAVSRGNLAIIYKNESNYERALDLYEKVRNELAALGDQSNVARVLHQIGNVHYLKEDHSAALKCYQESSEISQELGEEAIAIATRVQIANILYQLGDEEDALTNYRDIVSHLKRSGVEKNASLVGAVLVQMGQIHQKAKRYLEAETYFTEAEGIVRASDDKRSLIKVLRAKALVSRERREYEEAHTMYDEATRTAAELGDLVEAATCSLLSGDLEKDRVQFGKALNYYAVARDILHSAPARRVLSEEQIDVVMKVVRERVDELAGTMGPEAFERASRKYWDVTE